MADPPRAARGCGRAAAKRHRHPDLTPGQSHSGARGQLLCEGEYSDPLLRYISFAQAGGI